MSNKATGEIIDILPTETITSRDKTKTWQKLVFAIDTKEEYNNIIAFEVFGDEKVENFLKYNSLNKTVDVEYNSSSNKHNDKYFSKNSAWKVTKANDTETALAQAAATIDQVFPPAGDLNEADNDLPF